MCVHTNFLFVPGLGVGRGESPVLVDVIMYAAVLVGRIQYQPPFCLAEKFSELGIIALETKFTK